MLDLIFQFTNMIGSDLPQQNALSLLVIGSVGLGLIISVVRLITKIKAAAFFGG